MKIIILLFFLFCFSLNKKIIIDDNFEQKNISFEININTNTTIHYDNIIQNNETTSILNNSLIEGLNHTNKTVLEGIGQLIIRDKNPFTFPNINLLQSDINIELKKEEKKYSIIFILFIVLLLIFIISIVVYLEYNNKKFFNRMIKSNNNILIFHE